jgi:hypothetical protein
MNSFLATASAAFLFAIDGIWNVFVQHIPTGRALLSATIDAGQQYYQATQVPLPVPQVPLETLFENTLAFFLVLNPVVFWQKFQPVIYVWKFVGTYLSIVFFVAVLYVENKLRAFHREQEAKRAAADPIAYAHGSPSRVGSWSRFGLDRFGKFVRRTPFEVGAAVIPGGSGVAGIGFSSASQLGTQSGSQSAPEEMVFKEQSARTKKWQRVVDHVESENPNDWRLAILEADILLDELLTNMHAEGDTLGEKLKSMTSAEMPSIQLAWEGHKVRNQIAHEGANFSLSQREARRIVLLYERVLRQGLYM